MRKTHCMKKYMRKIAWMGVGCMMMVSIAGCTPKETDEKESTASVNDTETESESESLSNITDASEYYSKGLQDNGFFSDFDVKTAVTLGDYQSLTLTAEEIAYTQEDVENEIASILESYGEMVSDEGIEVQDGDVLNIDFVGSVDGEEFEGGSTQGAGTEVTLGQSGYIDGFLEQIVGHKTGETFDIEVTFPDPYPNNSDLAGKDAVFTITINSVKQFPQLTEEFVAEYYGGRYSSVDEFRKSVEANYADGVKKNAVWEKLLETVEISEYPKDYIDGIVSIAVMQQEYYIYNSLGIDLNTYLSAIGSDSDTFLEELKESAYEHTKTYLAAQYVCEMEGVEPTMENLKEYYVTNTEEEFQNWINYYGSGYIMQSVLLNVAANQVLKYTTIE
ncbi:MAG: trigger factor [Lachnospiraceae bacterium]